jgi:tRNA(Ile)-lysidine synthase
MRYIDPQWLRMKLKRQSAEQSGKRTGAAKQMEQKRLVTRESLTACGLDETSRVLVAFSGGADSTALLLAMYELREEGVLKVVRAAHLNHGIRGETAERDLRFCESLCNRLGIELVTERANIPAFAKETGMTLEQAAREYRYAFLERVRQSTGADCIATAHHKGDQAETVLMHLLRGSGTKGLTGMQMRNGAIIRPLLGTDREELLTYLSERGQDYCEDETNFVNDAFRNRVRNELIPYLKEFNPNVVEALNRTAVFCGEDEALLSELADEAEAKMLRGNDLDRRMLGELPPPLKARIVKKRLMALCGDVCEADVKRVLALCDAKTGTRIELNHGLNAWTDAWTLYIGGYPDPKAFEVPFVSNGRTVTPAGTLACERVDAYRPTQGGMEAYLDADALPSALIVRTRRDGDRFFPIGAPGAKKLKDVLIDKKIPRHMRDMPLVCAGNEVYYAVGLTVSERAKVRPDTKTILHITFTGGTDG